jgi:hypothetical protein
VVVAVATMFAEPVLLLVQDLACYWVPEALVVEVATTINQAEDLFRSAVVLLGESEAYLRPPRLVRRSHSEAQFHGCDRSARGRR